MASRQTSAFRFIGTISSERLADEYLVRLPRLCESKLEHRTTLLPPSSVRCSAQLIVNNLNLPTFGCQLLYSGSWRGNIPWKSCRECPCWKRQLFTDCKWQERYNRVDAFSNSVVKSRSSLSIPQFSTCKQVNNWLFPFFPYPDSYVTEDFTIRPHGGCGINLSICDPLIFWQQ